MYWFSRIVPTLAILATLPHPNLAFAENSEDSNSVFSGLTVKASVPSKKDSETDIILSWIKQLQPILRHFDQSPGLEIQLGDTSDAASANTIEYKVESSDRADNLSPSFTHEYGHTLFSQPGNLGRILPSCLYAKEDNIESQRLSLQMGKIRNQLYRTPDEYMSYALTSCTKNPRMQDRDYRDLCSEFESLEKKAKELNSAVEPLENELFAIKDPYDEFFADVLAVLATKDGQAMSKAIHDESRDFTSAGRARSNESQLDPHGYFFDTRRLIWNRFESQGKSLKSAHELLQVTYEAIGAELSRRLLDPRAKNLTKTEIENGLLSEITKRLH